MLQDYEAFSPAVSASDSTDSGLVGSISGSPVADQSRPLTPRHATASLGHMCPILETPRVAPDVTRHCDPTNSETVITEVEKDEVIEAQAPLSPTGLATMATLEPPKTLVCLIRCMLGYANAH